MVIFSSPWQWFQPIRVTISLHANSYFIALLYEHTVLRCGCIAYTVHVVVHSVLDIVYTDTGGRRLPVIDANQEAISYSGNLQPGGISSSKRSPA